jgi:oligoendopeptidase F
MDADLGGWFRLILARGLVDAEPRARKAPGANCAELPHQRLPFISMCASGAQSDIRTLMHEAGHAFHVLAASRHPLIWQRHVDLEAAELASTTLELLAAPHVTGPARFHAPADAARLHAGQLEEVLVKLAHIASVDAFQSWIYTHADAHDADARDAKWREIRRRFEPEVDWTGLEREEPTRWYRQRHIFQFPFYYIEYGIAQLGALQIWQQSLTDPQSALARYKRALALGGTVALPEMYRTAGASLVFDPERMAPLIGEVERALAALRESGVRLNARH